MSDVVLVGILAAFFTMLGVILTVASVAVFVTLWRAYDERTTDDGEDYGGSHCTGFHAPGGEEEE